MGGVLDPGERIELLLRYLEETPGLKSDSMTVAPDGVREALVMQAGSGQCVRREDVRWEDAASDFAADLAARGSGSSIIRGFVVPLYRVVSLDLREVAGVVADAPGNRIVVGFRRGSSPTFGCVCWRADLAPGPDGSPSDGFFCGPRSEVAALVASSAVVDSVMGP